MNTHAIREYSAAPEVRGRHRLPPLSYAVDALEPCIDARTMTLHHDAHHAAYVTNLNTALLDLPDLQEASALWLLCNLNEVPRESRAAVHHSAGGHDHPAMKGLVPLLLNDLWEHAYYLRYANRRDDYLNAWWKVVDWNEVSRRFADRPTS